MAAINFILMRTFSETIGLIRRMAAPFTSRRILTSTFSSRIQHGGRCNAIDMGGLGRYRNSKIGPPEENYAGHKKS